MNSNSTTQITHCPICGKKLVYGVYEQGWISCFVDNPCAAGDHVFSIKTRSEWLIINGIDIFNDGEKWVISSEGDYHYMDEEDMFQIPPRLQDWKKVPEIIEYWKRLQVLK